MIVETTRGSDFHGLHRYLTKDRDHEIVYTRGVTSAAEAASEMAMVAGERPTVRKPVLHVSISFAPEDTERVTDDLALELFAEIDRELGLSEHQCLVARHNDTPHKHLHAYANVVHPLEFETPADRPNQAGHDPAFQRRLRRKGAPRPLSWDAFMLPRLAIVCDRFAQKHGLRRVRLPVSGSAKASVSRPPPGALKREARTGTKPLHEQQDAIRAALKADTWEQRRAALAELGVELEAAEVAVKSGGTRIRGLRLVDAADRKNAIKASTLGADYGLAALDASVRSGSLRFEQWWADTKSRLLPRPKPPQVAASADTYAVYLSEYRRYEEEHAERRQAAKRARPRLKHRHRLERAQLTRRIGAERKRALFGVPKEFVPAARQYFRLRFSEPQRAELALRQREELARLRVPKKQGWTEWLRERLQAGDIAAGRLLGEMEARHRRRSHGTGAAERLGTANREAAQPRRSTQEKAGRHEQMLSQRPQDTSYPVEKEEPDADFDRIVEQAHMARIKGKGGAGR